MNASLPPVFITAVYGESHFSYVTAHLGSVFRAHPEAPQVLLWQDLPSQEIDLLQIAFPNLKTHRIEYEIGGRRGERIPRKLHAWQQASRLYDDGRPLIFLDSDTIVVRPLTPFLDLKADVTFTWSDSEVPVNSGVILARAGEPARLFFDRWIELTEKLIADKKKFSRGRVISGGGSQHSLRMIIGWVNYDRNFSLLFKERSVTFQGVSAERLNQTRGVPLTPDLFVMHYKGAWHRLLQGLPGFAAKQGQSEDECAAMYSLWLDSERESCRHVARSLANRLNQEVNGGIGLKGLEATLARPDGVFGPTTLTLLTAGDDEASGARDGGSLHPAVGLSDGWLKSAQDSHLQIESESGSNRTSVPLRLEKEVPPDCVAFYLDASLAEAAPAVLASLLLRNPLPRIVLLEIANGDGRTAERIERLCLRWAWLPDSNDGRRRMMVLPRRTESLQAKVPSNGLGLGRLHQRLRALIGRR